MSVMADDPSNLQNFIDLSEGAPLRVVGISVAGFLSLGLVLRRWLRMLGADASATKQDAANTVLYDTLIKEIDRMKADNDRRDAIIETLKAQQETLMQKHRVAQTVAIDIYANAFTGCPFCVKSKELARKIFES